MDILIIEDEPRAADRLQALLEGIDVNYNIVGMTASIQQTVSWLNNNNTPDLIMMDIHLADGHCFSIFEVCNVLAPIIFCTAYDEYALQAFQSNGVAYLLKPITNADLQEALNKLKRLRKALTAQDISFRKQVLNRLGVPEEGYRSRFLIKAGDKLLPILTTNIACFLSAPHGLKVHLLNGDSYYIDYSLAELVSMLNPNTFFKISRQAIISNKAVTSATANIRQAKVRLVEIDQDLPIARSKVKAFRQWLEN